MRKSVLGERMLSSDGRWHEEKVEATCPWCGDTAVSQWQWTRGDGQDARVVSLVACADLVAWQRGTYGDGEWAVFDSEGGGASAVS